VAQQPRLGAAYLHGDAVLLAVGGFQGNAENDPFETGLAGVYDLCQHGLAHVGAQRVGGTAQQVEFPGAENKLGGGMGCHESVPEWLRMRPF